MKVLLINGSPHEKGCTYTALMEIDSVLKQEGIETELFHIGTQPIRGCIACGQCSVKGGYCVFDDAVNSAKDKAKEADGFVFGAPVHYAAINGAMSAFMDRLFYSGKSAFVQKPAAAIVSARRAGTTASLDQLHKYFLISNMVLTGSQYWAMVHGNKPKEVLEDLEGLQTMRTIGRNLAWLMKVIELGKQNGIAPPAPENKIQTNFIR
ncbi:flavodoxin family protein [Christensenellaceae bacterium OttesenSCG-928-M15]|nr:flavodoxin family protein [Christensenellaceae bacterium OttesenSCG-928-M15]